MNSDMSDDEISAELLTDAPDPALLAHAKRLYKLMYDKGVKRTEGQVYTGFLTKDMEELELSAPYYTHVTRVLKAMDCIQQIRRGGGASPSIWLLKQQPTRELYDHATNATFGKLNSRSGKANLQQFSTDMTNRINAMEAQLLVIVAVLEEAGLLEVEE